MRRLRALVLAVVASAGMPAAAATFVVPSVEEMARSSDAVVRGRVVAIASRRDAGGRIVTDVDVAVASAWRGAAGPAVRLVVPGGRAGGLALRVDGAPTFEPGEEVVLFLTRAAAGWRVNGHALGKFRVDGAEARSALGGANVLPGPLGPGERRAGAMPLDELERRVRAAR
ncbi:MAG TPA: hypothetical protein VFK90_15545 [Anaeromyxobacter sp.]|nr:hypothetical protein [Anaeromyxobacter sp.]